MRTASDIVSMRLSVLYVLYDLESAAGTTIAGEIEEMVGGDVYTDRVYETLYDLRDEGLISHKKRNPTRGQFELTDDGRERLEEHHEWADNKING